MSYEMTSRLQWQILQDDRGILMIIAALLYGK